MEIGRAEKLIGDISMEDGDIDLLEMKSLVRILCRMGIYVL